MSQEPKDQILQEVMESNRKAVLKLIAARELIEKWYERAKKHDRKNTLYSDAATIKQMADELEIILNS